MTRTMLFTVVLLWLVSWQTSQAQTAAEDVLSEASPTLRRVFAGSEPKNVAELKEMEQYLRQLSKKVLAATVALQIDTAHGSGVVVGDEGYVLTAAHVIGSPGRPVRFQFPDGRTAFGKTLGVHMPLDAGVAQINDPGDWPHLQIGNSSKMKPGQWCLAAGHPGGYDRQRGPVLRLGRILETGDLLRTDCQLNAGDSGGPLVNARGQVIAIHSRIGTSLTNNLHAPSASYRDRWADMVVGTLWRSPAYLGVRGDNRTHEPRVGVVHAGSPADRAGIQVGDYVTQFAGHEVHTFRDLVYMVQSRHPGEEVQMEISRDGKKRSLEIVVGNRPEPSS